MFKKHFWLLSPDDTGGSSPATTPQAGDGGNAPLPQAGNTPPPEPQAGEGQQSETISLEEAKKLRSEAANLRKRMKAFEDADQAARDAQLSEVERVKKQHSEATAQLNSLLTELQEERVQNAVARHAAKLNFILSAERIAQLLSWSEIEFEDGRPTNIEKLLESLAKAEPDLVRKAEATTTPATPAQSAQAPTPPALPAMNQGRTSIVPPSSLPAGKIPTLAEAYARNKQQR